MWDVVVVSCMGQIRSSALTAFAFDSTIFLSIRDLSTMLIRSALVYILRLGLCPGLTLTITVTLTMNTTQRLTLGPTLIVTLP